MNMKLNTSTEDTQTPFEFFIRNTDGTLRCGVRVEPGVVLNITAEGPELTAATEWELKPQSALGGARQFVMQRKTRSKSPSEVLVEYFKSEAPIAYIDDEERSEGAFVMAEDILMILRTNCHTFKEMLDDWID